VEPFKHAAALKGAQTDSARIDQLMADAAKPEEPAQQEPPTEVDPRMEDRRSRVFTTRVCPRFGRRPALPEARPCRLAPVVPAGPSALDELRAEPDA
jgi:hypothetical protein